MKRPVVQLPAQVWQRARSLVETSAVADAHGHPQAVVPRPLRRLAEKVAHVPHDPLETLATGGVNLAVITAVGDAMATAGRPRSALDTVYSQLAASRREAFTARLPITTTVAGIGADTGHQVLLGIEGGDVIGDDPGCLARLYDVGVRLVGLVHYADNNLGTISTSVTGRRGSHAVRSGTRPAGLTGLGVEIVGEMNSLGIAIDLAHADRATTLAVCETTTRPLISSHTGAASVRDFPRYITDVEIEAIAGTGGVIGLWPARIGSMAMSDLDDFARHAYHLAERVGIEHICIGTDKNGVTAYAEGYRNSNDFVGLAAALLYAGFGESDVAQILGANLLRVLTDILQSHP